MLQTEHGPVTEDERVAPAQRWDGQRAVPAAAFLPGGRVPLQPMLRLTSQASRMQVVKPLRSPVMQSSRT